MIKNYNGFRLSEDGLSILDSQGSSHTLRRKSLLVFETLAAADGDSCTKQELLDTVWSSVEVTEDSLVQCIAEIRRLLGDKDKRVLQTIPRHGYRLVPDSADTPLPHDKPKGFRVGAISAICVLVVLLTVWFFRSTETVQQAEKIQARPAILITQFEHLSDEPRWERLASGLTSELVVELAKNSWLRILRLENEEQLSAEILEVANPRYIISGTLQAEGEQLRISSQLKEIPSNEIIWSERWNKPAKQLFTVQDEILNKINSTIGGAWTGVVAKYGLSQTFHKPTKSLDAYELYLLGVEHKHKFTPENNKKAIEYLDKAIAIDPDFGQAWSTLSIVHMNSSRSVESTEEAVELIEKQMKAASNAYKLIPENPEAIISYSWVKAQHGDQAEVDKLLDTAVKKSWNNPDILAYATWAGSSRASSQLDIVAWGKRAIDLNPNHPAWYLYALSAAQFQTNKPKDALNTLRDTGVSFTPLLYAAGSFVLEGDMENAMKSREKALSIEPGYMIKGELEHNPILDSERRDRYISSLSTAGFK